jgi:hypothetical protein
MTLFLLLTACTGETDTAADVDATVTFLSPADGDEVPVGDLACSVVVENFLLTDPAKHGGEEEPEGYIGVSVDGTEVLQSSATNFTITLDTAGVVELTAELFYANDGDSLDEPAVATVSLTVTE